MILRPHKRINQLIIVFEGSEYHQVCGDFSYWYVNTYHHFLLCFSGNVTIIIIMY